MSALRVNSGTARALATTAILVACAHAAAIELSEAPSPAQRDAAHGGAPRHRTIWPRMSATGNCWRTVMDQATRLRWAAVAFAIFWIGGMLWWSGENHPAHIVILAVCGSLGG